MDRSCSVHKVCLKRRIKIGAIYSICQEKKCKKKALFTCFYFALPQLGALCIEYADGEYAGGARAGKLQC